MSPPASLLVTVLGCASAPEPAPTAAAPGKVSLQATHEATPDPLEDPPPARCPALDLDHPDRLDPPAPPADGRPAVSLAALAPPVPSPPGPVERHDLGRIEVGPVAASPRSHSTLGMGWVWLEPDVVRPGLPAPLLDPFEAWVEARESWAALQAASYRIDQRLRYLQTMADGPEAWGGWRCSSAAKADLAVGLERARRTLHARARDLTAALEHHDGVSPHVRLLLATMRTGPRMPGPRASAQQRARTELEALARDEQLDPELRARSYRELARIESDVHGPAFRRALEAVVALSSDPELRISAQLKLAQVEPDVRRRLELELDLLDEIDDQIEAQVATQNGDPPGRWRVGMVASHAAEHALALGDFAGAVELGARCARASPADFPRQPDPWGCAPELASALVELGPGQVPDLEVPAGFVGPLAVAWVRAALARHDYDGAGHVAEVALDRAPRAAQAPELLHLRLGLSTDPSGRAALEDRIARDYGPNGAWWRLHRERLAWRYDAAEVRAQLEQLRAPPSRAHTARPSTAAERTEDLRSRAQQSAFACLEHFQTAASPLTVAVDTSRGAPRVEVRGGSPKQKACVRQRARARFLSVGSARVTFTLAVSEG